MAHCSGAKCMLPPKRDDASMPAARRGSTSVRIVFPGDAAALSRACDAVLCLLVRDGCPSCDAFAPTWSALGEAARDANPRTALVHAECSEAAVREEARALMMPTRQAFPTLLVCVDGRVGVVPSDDMAVETVERMQEAVRKVRDTLQAPSDTLAAPSPMDALELREETTTTDDESDESDDDDDDRDVVAAPSSLGELQEETVDDDEQDAAAVTSGPTMLEHARVLVTSALAPDAVLRAAASATADRRVCVLYYTDWCGFCTQFKPIFNRCVQYSHDRGYGDHLRWYAIDCATEEGAAASGSAGVRGFPTVHLHAGAEAEPFDGERTPVALMRFVRRRTPTLLRFAK